MMGLSAHPKLHLFAIMDSEDDILSKEYFKMMTDMIVLCATLALSLFFWIISLTMSAISGNLQPVSPWRWLFSILAPLTLTVRALKRRSLNRSGALGEESCSTVKIPPCMKLTVAVLQVGPGEIPIDFGKQYSASWMCLSLLGALACSAGDTWASEVGPILSQSQPRLITTWKEVPAGKKPFDPKFVVCLYVLAAVTHNQT
ncbi:hypothetical protein XENOCAPTIV_020627 [Xenoophorus captivus]|uniref:Transmembrane protein 19 n=1 Tax=Xenoophorus captivus TaxID=1517983 RepID=A0ABV0Q4Q8_9TELE